MIEIYKKQLAQARERVKEQTARLLLRFDGDHGVGQYLRLSSEDWSHPYTGVAQTLCSLSSVQEHSTISNIVFEPGSIMESHRHDRNETMFVLSGDLRELVSGEQLVGNQVKEIPAGQLHGWTTKEGALATVVWKPQLCPDDPDVMAGLSEDPGC